MSKKAQAKKDGTKQAILNNTGSSFSLVNHSDANQSADASLGAQQHQENDNDGSFNRQNSGNNLLDQSVGSTVLLHAQVNGQPGGHQQQLMLNQQQQLNTSIDDLDLNNSKDHLVNHQLLQTNGDDRTATSMSQTPMRMPVTGNNDGGNFQADFASFTLTENSGSQMIGSKQQ